MKSCKLENIIANLDGKKKVLVAKKKKKAQSPTMR